VGKLTPRVEQAVTIERILAEPTRAYLLADDMGQGKTLQAVEVGLQGEFARVLIIGIKDTAGQWASRLAEQSDGVHMLRRIDATKAGKAHYEAYLAGEDGWFFTGSQLITSKDWKSEPKLDSDGVQEVDKNGKPVNKRVKLGTFKKVKPADLLIYDEIHVVSNRASVGRKTLVSIRADFKLALSGTFYGNKFEGAHSVARWLWPDLIEGNYYTWKEKYCTSEDVYVAKDETKSVVTGEREPGRFVSELPGYSRVEAAEQPPPAKIVHCTLTPKERKSYSELEADLMTWLDSRTGPAPLIAELPIVLRTRLRTATLGEMVFDDDGEISFSMDAESSKLNALRTVLDYWGKDEQAAIYTDSKRFAKVAVARMRAAGYNAVEWSGDVSSKDRDQIKEDFIAGRITFLVCVIAAFNAGLDGFQAVCRHVVWLSRSENQVQCSQALARFFRPGRVGEFTQVEIVARDTYDEAIFSSSVAQRLAVLSTLKVAA